MYLTIIFRYSDYICKMFLVWYVSTFFNKKDLDFLFQHSCIISIVKQAANQAELDPITNEGNNRAILRIIISLLCLFKNSKYPDRFSGKYIFKCAYMLENG